MEDLSIAFLVNTPYFLDTQCKAISSSCEDIITALATTYPQISIGNGGIVTAKNGNPALAITMSGPKQHVLAAKGNVMRTLKRKYRRYITVSPAVVTRNANEAGTATSTDINQSYQDIAHSSSVEFAIGDDRFAQGNKVSPDGWYEQRETRLAVSGSMENVEKACQATFVCQDESEGLHTGMCEIDYKLQPIIAGRQGQALQAIQEQTGTNIYLSTALAGICDDPPPGHKQGVGYRHLAVPPIQHQHQYQQQYAQHHFQNQPPAYQYRPDRVPHIPIPLQPNMTGASRTTDMSSQAMSIHPSTLGDQHLNGSQNMTGHHATNGQSPVHGHHHMNPHGHQHGMPVHYNAHLNGHQTPPGPQYRSPTHLSDGQGSAPPPYMQRPSPNQALGRHGLPPPPGWQQHSLRLRQDALDRGLSLPGDIRAMPSQAPNRPPPMQMQNTGYSSSGFHLGRAGSPLTQNQYLGPVHSGTSMVPDYGQGQMPRPPFDWPLQNHTPARPMGPPKASNNVRLPAQPVDWFQGPHPGLWVHNGEHGNLHQANQVVITGDPLSVQRATTILRDLANQKRHMIVSRDIAIHPRKLDWILTEKLDELQKIMSDNATYVQVPSVGAGQCLITVFGDYHVNIHRTIRLIVALASKVYQASIFLLSKSDPLESRDVRGTLKDIAISTSAEIVYKTNCFEISGLESQVQAACRMILDLEAVQDSDTLVKFQVEASAERREFIAGKKHGKFHTISKTCNVAIKTESLHDHSFMIVLCGSGHAALQGLALLSGELPAEISFYIPQSYHKGIIGVGGSHVQTIMSKFEVYIHCADRDEHIHRGGYFENEDNTYIQCPTKNLPKLALAKDAILDHIAPLDKNYRSEVVEIPRRHHRVLLSEKSIFLRCNGQDVKPPSNRYLSGTELASHRCKIRFPSKESGSDEVVIFGPESFIPGAKDLLLSHVPYGAELRVPNKAEIGDLVASEEFSRFAETVKVETRVSVRSATDAGSDKEGIFQFKCQMNQKPLLMQARKMLVKWLEEHGIETYPAVEPEVIEEKPETLFGAGVEISGTSNHVIDAPTRTSVGSVDVQALFEGSDYNGHAAGSGFAGPLAFPNGRNTDWPAPIPHPATAVAPSRADVLRRDTDPLDLDSIHPVIPRHRPGAHSQRGIASRTLSYDVASDLVTRTFLGGHPLSSGPSGPRPNVTTPHAGPSQPLHHGTTVGGRFSIDSITKGLKDTKL